MIGETVTHYRILDKIGEGGMGVVYRAEDTRLGRMVAVKFLSQDLLKDPLALERFPREAREASLLNPPLDEPPVNRDVLRADRRLRPLLSYKDLSEPPENAAASP